MFRFGPSGIPLSCKGRTFRDGIEDVHSLGLTAMEVQLVRLNISERYVTDEEVGHTPLQIQGELPVEIVRKEGSKLVSYSNLKMKLEKGDLMRMLNSNFVHDYAELQDLGKMAKEFDVQLSLHTPYYMDLASSGDMVRRSMDAIKWSTLIADQMNACIVVTHLGMYGTLTKDETAERMYQRLSELNLWRQKNGITVPLGIETSGRQEVFGSLDEIEALCRKVPGVKPVLNFAHIHARENGSLRKKENFAALFDRLADVCGPHFYTHFSGVEYRDGNELRYTPIKKGDLKFELLAECVLDNEYNVTFVSSSPLLEHDAMYMRVILERVLAKKEMKKKQKAAPPQAERKAKPEKAAKPAKKPKTPAKKPAKAKKSTQKKKALKPAAKSASAKKGAAKKPSKPKTPRKPAPKAKPKAAKPKPKAKPAAKKRKK